MSKLIPDQMIMPLYWGAVGIIACVVTYIYVLACPYGQVLYWNGCGVDMMEFPNANIKLPSDAPSPR